MSTCKIVCFVFLKFDTLMIFKIFIKFASAFFGVNLTKLLQKFTKYIWQFDVVLPNLLTLIIFVCVFFPSLKNFSILEAKNFFFVLKSTNLMMFEVHVFQTFVFEKKNDPAKLRYIMKPIKVRCLFEH